MLFASLPLGIAEAREVRIGLYENQPKIFTNEQGTPSGIFAQLLGLIGKREAWQLQYVACEWQSCLKQLSEGRIDLLPDVALTEKRKQLFDFHSTPGLYSWSQVYRHSNIAINSPLDLNGKRVALLKGSIQQNEFANMVKGFGIDLTIITTNTYEQAFQLVQDGKADAVIANHFFGGYHAAHYHLIETPVIFQPSRLFFATGKGTNTDLLDTIERYLSTWQKNPDSPYYAILKQWDQRVPTSLVPKSLWHTLLFILALLLVTGLIALLLKRRLNLRTRHLFATKNRFQTTLDALPDLLFELDSEGRYLDYHSPRTDLLAAPPAIFLGKTVQQILPGEAADITLSALDEAGAEGFSMGREIALDLADGKHWFELSVSRLDDDHSKAPTFIMLSRDVTARKLSETRIERLTRFYATLSQCNQAIVRCQNQEELFPIICRNAVHYGGLKMAWIGMLDKADDRVRPVASHGEGEAYLQQIELSANADEAGGSGPTGISIRENRPVWCQDFQSDPITAHWREQGRQFEWRASAALPLHCKGEVVGAFMLYSDELSGFDPEVQNLLVEMSVDISFALNQFALRDEHRQTLSALQESEERYRLAFKTSPDAVNINRLEDGVYLDVNAGFESLTGWQSSEVIGRSSLEIDIWRNPEDRKKLVDCLRTHGVCENFEAGFRMKGGDHRVGMMSAKLIRLNGEPCILSITRDVTELRQATDQLNKLSLAVEQSPASIVITDLDARIEYVNETFVRMTGYDREEVIGKNPRFQRSGKTPDKTYQEMWSNLIRGEVWRGELFNCRKDGSEYIESTLIYPVRQNDGKITHYLAIKEDISEKVRTEQVIHKLAYFDQLTGLANINLLKEHFAYSINLAHREDEPLAVMLLDLDHFQAINDTLGHSFGDRVLIEIGNRLQACIGEHDILARMGGDEFIILLPGADELNAARMAGKLIAAVSRPCQIDSHELTTTPSIGITLYPHDGHDVETLLKNADNAMYRAKKDGRSDFRFFAQEMQQHSARTLYLANALRHALERDQFQLHYQPQIKLQNSRLVGAEALLRWQHPEFGMVSPAEFIPIAEESGQIIQIGEWVLRTAVTQLKRWFDQGMPPIVMAVNLSAAQFRHAGLEEMVISILTEAGLPHEYLELELTEAVAMKTPQTAVAIMDRLHAQGIRMSIDDFGTGYSSLSYLKRFKVYKLKIDQSFVRDIREDPEDKAIVTAIINLADSLGLHTIAEGVETEEQLSFLRLQGCQEAQGYHFSKPLPADAFQAFVETYLQAHQVQG